MATTAEKAKQRGNALVFIVDYDTKPDQPIEVIGHAFNRFGKHLTSAPLRDGLLEFPTSLLRSGQFRLFLAPLAPDDPKKAPTLEDMERLRAYEPIWKLEPNRLRYPLQPIPKDLWKWWWWCRCRVRGRVVKPVTINGYTVDKPVCDAVVHICEVDRLILILPQLPDPIVWRLRDELLDVLRKPPRIPPIKLYPETPVLRRPPLPDPPPIFPVDPEFQVKLNPQPEPPARLNMFDRLSRVALNPQPLPPKAANFSSMSRRQIAAFDPQPEPPGKAVFRQLSPETQSGLLSESLQVVKQTLAANPKLILPYLCLWPWFWPYICTCDELTTVTTDGSGRFDTDIWYRCFGDHPDLYFWVEYLIDGAYTTVYHPTICCHTYWEYACGSEVTIRVTDPRVPICEDLPDLEGLQVVIAAIGNGVSMSEIHHTGPNKGLTTTSNPFASTLELRMDMSRGNLIGIGVTHYRWSFKRIEDGDGNPVSDSWHPMTHQVDRHYKVMVPDPTAPGGFKPYYPPEKMGPDNTFPGDYLFKIQPVPPPAGAIEWHPLNEHVDLAWAHFETEKLFEPGTEGTADPVPAAGKYELKLELFKSDGTLVNWSNPTGSATPTPIAVFMSSNAAPFVPPVGMTVDPAPASHLITGVGGDVLGFKMTLHVDNFPCEAFIFDTWVDDASNAAGPCGFIRFANRATSQAHLSFKALHPHDFGVFWFQTVKGSSGGIADASADWGASGLTWAPLGSSPVNGFSEAAGGIYSKALGVATLLDANGTNCNEAAFAETMYVASTATNGYTQAYWLDASATPRAFALAPLPSTGDGSDA